jgi:hypothetical protein
MVTGATTMTTTYGNIVGMQHKGVEIRAITNFLEPLIHELACKYPQWTFKATNVKAEGEGEYAIGEFHIFDKREKIGEIGMDTRYFSYKREKVYVIENERIASVRQRSSSVRTADMKRAIAVVKKFVSPKGLKERFAEEVSNAFTKMAEVESAKVRAKNLAYQPIPALRSRFVDARMEEFMASLSAQEVEIHAASDAATHEAAILYKLKEDVTNNKAVFVHVHGEDYLMGANEGSLEYKYSEELPPHIRMAVGMLKLVQPSQIIEGVGMKVNDGTFIVTRKADE